MRQALSLIGCVMVQSLLGKGVAWGNVRPEADFALLILLSLSAGRMRGAVLGALVGALRDTLSIRPFGLGIFVLASIGFFAGFLGERRYFQRPWQKIVLVFGLFFLSDGLLLFLGEGISVSNIFPSALFATFMGVVLWCFLSSG